MSNRKATGQDLWTIVGVSIGVVTTFVSFNRQVLAWPSLKCWMAIGFAVPAVLAYHLLCRMSPAPPERKRRFDTYLFFDIVPVPGWSLCLSTAAILAITLYSWEQPSSHAIAQETLNSRGMSLERRYYKTVLEVGNAAAVQLFHDAGFTPSLAYSVLGEAAATQPDQRAVDLLLSLDDREVLQDILSVLAPPMSARVAIRPELDTLVRYRNEDSGAHSVRPLTALEEVRDVNALLARDGLSLLGHALLNDRPVAADVLLELGANPALATLPLMAIGQELAPRFHGLAMDPFLHRFETVGERSRPTAPAFEPFLLIDFRPSALLPPHFVAETYEEHGPPSCSDVFELPERLIGYHVTPQSRDRHAFVKLSLQRVLSCDPVQRAEYTVESMPSPLTETAVITTRGGILSVTSRYTFGGSHLALFVPTSTLDSSSAYYRGQMKRNPGHVQLRSADGETMSIVAVDEDLSLMTIGEAARDRTGGERVTPTRHDCADGNGITLEMAVPAHVHCNYATQVTWETTVGLFLIHVVAEATSTGREALDGCPESLYGGSECLFLSVERPFLDTARGSYVLSARSMDDAQSLHLIRRELMPRVVETADTEWVYLWPREPYEATETVDVDRDQLVHLWLDELAAVRLHLTDLDADVDLYLESEVHDTPVASSTLGATNAEEIYSILDPGRYLVRVTAFDGSANFALSMARETIELGAVTSEAGVQRQVTKRHSGDELLSFGVEQDGLILIGLESTDPSVGLEVLDGNGERLGESLKLGPTAQFVAELEIGRYYVRVAHRRTAQFLERAIGADEDTVTYDIAVERMLLQRGISGS